MKKPTQRWLFVAYGSGHIAALLPVARRARELSLAEPVILALTTAAEVVRKAGFEPMGFADFVQPSDKAFIRHGRELASALTNASVDAVQTAAYLGLSYADLELRVGSLEAANLYSRLGRQCFEPVGVLDRIIRSVKPSVVVATSAPRAEKAAIIAAAQLGVPAVCVADLFAVDEVAWLARPGFANRIAVLSESVRQFILAHGRKAQEIVVTGNPAFDQLRSDEMFQKGSLLRRRENWTGRDVVLWAAQPEPLTHPSLPGKRGDPDLPQKIIANLSAWASQDSRRLVIFRPHPSEPDAVRPIHPQVRLDGRSFGLHPLLHAVNAVVTMNSTVGVEASLIGCPVIQVLGSIADESVPLAKYRMAVACSNSDLIGQTLDQRDTWCTGISNDCASKRSQSSSASENVTRLIKELVA